MDNSQKLLVRPIHSIDFLRENDLLVEAHYPRYTCQDGWSAYEPFVGGFHLPYYDMNLAGDNEELRRSSIEAIKKGIDFGSRYPVDRMVMHTVGIETDSSGKKVGKYENLIVSLYELCDYAKKKGIILCFENALAVSGLMGASAESWINILKDVNHPEAKLTFDSSHAVVAAHRYSEPAKRLKELYAFLDEPELIGRVHWSDSYLYSDRGKSDMHLIPGAGDIPREFHQAINALQVPKLLEQNCSEDEVLRALEFISAL